jgi:cyclic-di-GMP phosphodiesterase TipF (flagellum assembly factor)
MVRLNAIFVAICMVLIAAAAGAVLYLWFGLSGAESSIVGLAAFTALALYNTVSSRLRDRGDFGSHIADLSRGTADLARQVAELGRRLSAMETNADAVVDRALAVTKPISAEIDELGALMKQLAETVSAHETALRAPPPRRTEFAAVPPPAAPSPPVSLESDLGVRADPEKAANRDDSGRLGDSGRFKDVEPVKEVARFKDLEGDAAVAVIREAIEANRVDLYLQPIVTLPQRKVRFYEAMARLRTGEGEIVLPADFLDYAESAGLMPKLDNIILFRCVQVLRRLLAKNRDVGLFCNLSTSTLGDSAFFPQLSEFMDANRALAPSLVFELKQAAYRALGPIEVESLGALADRGFRFSMDHVGDLRLEPRDLAERGFRFIKVPSTLLLNRAGPAASDIHPADFAGLLSRFGIEMIAERIESEGVVVDILDYDVKYGQGFLFSPPRPVRPEVMQGIPERTDVPVRDHVEPARPSAAPSPTVEMRPPASQRASALAQLARGVVARS